MLMSSSAATSASLGSSFLPRSGVVADRGLSLRRIFDLSRQKGSVRVPERRPFPSFAVRADANAFATSVNVEAQTKLPAVDSSAASESTPRPTVTHLFRYPFLSEDAARSLLQKAQLQVSDSIAAIATEQCFNIQLSSPPDERTLQFLRWLLAETYEPEKLLPSSLFGDREAALHQMVFPESDDPSATPSDGSDSSAVEVVEVGPRLSFMTAWSANAVSICRACNVGLVTRIERSRRYALLLSPEAAPLTAEQRAAFASLVHDRMTECVYETPLESFQTSLVPAPVLRVPVMELGRSALETVNQEMGLAFDEFDLDYYTRLFRDEIRRDPTNVELFDIAQSNSEHSRHWFFQGEMVVDGESKTHTLMDLVKATLKANPNNSVIGFKDNSSAIRGGVVSPILPVNPGQPSPLEPTERDLDILFTAETHNFPCAVAPFPGAETGAGGRIRDTHATGIGSLIGAATAGYCVGNLQLESHAAPWEDSTFEYPDNLAPPLQILLDSSDGASDYGNKFGEPLIQGYTRTFGMRLPSGERREWIKPIMFSAGIGQIDHRHLRKSDPDIGMLVIKIGGPAYRIGMGGGAASSMVSGTRDAALDFDAVQRGDAEMSQKLNRVVRTCVDLGDKNPIVSIHDQGAGGNCNVVKEIIYPKGAEIDVRKIVVGDETMSVLEIWGAEYQEQDAILIKPESEELLRSICDRERLSMAVIGTISGDGKVVLVDSQEREKALAAGLPPPLPAVDLDLEKVLGDMPQKTFSFNRSQDAREPLDLPPDLTVERALQRVLRLPSVASKRFLTSKVDRCVTGLVAQQQTVGPLQVTLADVAVVAQTHSGLTGGACAIGEQPIKGLLNPAAMARLAVGEALTNLVWAKVTKLEDVKASGNWMYAAKMDSEGADMYDAAVALRDAMIELGIAIDGGKDSLSMAAKAGNEVVKAPGNIVISAYCTCPDITLTVTPDLKLPDEGVLLHIDLSGGHRRLGGSAFAQVFDQVGDRDSCPDVDIPLLKRAFNAVQHLISLRLISAGHDISDGGLLTAAMEMAFAGNCGLSLSLSTLSPSPSGQPSEGATIASLLESDGPTNEEVFAALFAEELGLLLEVSSANQSEVLRILSDANVPCTAIGQATSSPLISLSIDNLPFLPASSPTTTVAQWRDAWDEASSLLERVQRTEACATAERAAILTRPGPSWKLPFVPAFTPELPAGALARPRVGVLREEGSNGDREMAAAVWMAGCQPFDLTVSDLLAGRASLSDYRGLIFVGGFSYGDVLDSAKGWAASLRFSPSLLQQLNDFYRRPDTFSLGVCNGCQLMALLGWVPGPEVGGVMGEGGDPVQPRFVHNQSGRFECRFSTVEILPSPAVMLKGMEGTRVGVWVAHGEGRALFPSPDILSTVLSSNLAPIRYCDDEGKPTEAYPFNPNGSPAGIAALCSPDGRHLAMMPHPERCFLSWQMPWVPGEVQASMPKSGPSPWLKIFQNARDWCLENDAK